MKEGAEKQHVKYPKNVCAHMWVCRLFSKNGKNLHRNLVWWEVCAAEFEELMRLPGGGEDLYWHSSEMGSRVLVPCYFCLWFSCLRLGMQKTCKPKLVAIVFVEGDSPSFGGVAFPLTMNRASGDSLRCLTGCPQLNEIWFVLLYEGNWTKRPGIIPSAWNRGRSWLVRIRILWRWSRSAKLS